MGRPMRCLVLKGDSICADVFCFVFPPFFFLLDSLDEPMSRTYQLSTQFCHTTNVPLRWLPSRLVDHLLLLLLRRPQEQQHSSGTAATQQQHSSSTAAAQQQHSSSRAAARQQQHLSAAATPAACCCNTGCCNTSCYRSVIRKEQKKIDRLAGASHATTAVLIPGSTTTHKKVNVATTFGQKMSHTWAIFTIF